jgi:Protein of Unknown function (DUF2784)
MSLNKPQKFFYQSFANLVFLVHLGLVFLVVLGWLIPSLFYFFLGAIIATIVSEILLRYCFLSKLEFWIRKKIDPAKLYDKSCIVHYARAWIGLPPRALQNSAELTFFKKNTFVFLLCFLLLVGVSYQIFIIGL